MSDNPVYWSESPGWYQPPGPQNHVHSQYPPNNYQPPTPAQADLASRTPPTQQQQVLPNESINGVHLNHMQSPMQSQTPSNSLVTNNVNQYNQQQVTSVQHEQQAPQIAPTQQSQLSMQPQAQQLDGGSGYPMKQQNYARQQQQQQQQHQHLHQQHQSQVYAQQSNNSAPPSSGYPPPPPPPHASSVPGAQPPHSFSTMQQTQHQQQPPLYPQQQYSPAPYWNSGPAPMQNQHQSHYGPPSAPQGGPMPQSQHLHQGSVPTPPMLPDNPSPYHSNGGPPPAPQPLAPHPAQQQSAALSSMPYDSRAQNLPGGYNNSYQQPAPVYYNQREMHQAQGQPSALNDSYEHHHLPNQPPHHQPTNQQPWSNGYYQSNQAPYPSSYNSSVPPYNGQSGHDSMPPPLHSLSGQNQQPNVPTPPQHYFQHQHPSHQQHRPQTQPPPPYYPGHPQHHQQHLTQPQQWHPLPPQQNHTMPIIERNCKTGQEKKPVKPRAPKKQPNPNAPKGRRKTPYVTKEQRLSGYGKFFQRKRKELGISDLGLASTMIADLWAKLSDEEKSIYNAGVSTKRKEFLKSQASQQAQELLQTQDIMKQEVSTE